MKQIPLTLTLILASLFALSQHFEKQFNELSSRSDTAGQIKLLKEWETSTPKDPELFIAYFNYYIRQSSKEIVSIDKKQKNETSLALNDTGTGKPVAYLNSSVGYDPATLQKGFDYIDRGISLYPTRLDMRFGRIYLLGKTGNYSEFTQEIIRTIEYGSSSSYTWLWKEGKPLSDPKEFFLGSIQDYISTLYNTGEDRLLPNMRQISEAVLKYFPDHVESLSNVALTYLITGDHDKALPYLLKAETIAPRDVVVLNNIAEAYKRKDDKVRSKLYYEKVIKYGDKEEVQDARAKMKGL